MTPEHSATNGENSSLRSAGHSKSMCLIGAIRAQYSILFQDAEGSMRLFMWHKDQKAVSHCLTAILQMAQTSVLIERERISPVHSASIGL